MKRKKLLRYPMKFVTGIGGAVKKSIKKIQKNISSLGSSFKKIPKIINNIIQGIYAFISNALKNMYIFVNSIITTVISFFALIFNAIKNLFINIFLIIKKGIIGMLNLIKKIILSVYNFIKMILKNIIKYIKITLIFIGKILKVIIINIYKVLKIILLFIGNVLKKIITTIYNILKVIIINIFKALKIMLIYIGKAIKAIFVFVGKTIRFIVKYVFKTIRTIIVTLFNVIKAMIVYLFIGIQVTIMSIINVVGLVLGYIASIFNKIIMLFVSLIKYITKQIKVMIIKIPANTIKTLKFIKQIPSYIILFFKWIGLSLYKIFVYPFIYLYKNIGKFLKEAYSKLKELINKTISNITDYYKKLINKAVSWFNNLSIVKDMRNRKEMKRQALLIDYDAENDRSDKKINYYFVAKNPEGKIEKGYLGAYSKLDVHSYLLAEGFEVYEITPAKKPIFAFSRSYKMKTSELVFMLTQLSTYIKSGITLVDSIKILGKQTRKGSAQNLYKAIIYDLTMGDSFSEALEKQSEVFPKLLVNMIKASELAGNLTEALDDMSQYYLTVSQTRKQFKSAMTYPLAIMVFAFGVVIFIMTFVIPSFIKMYDEADASIPTITLIIIKISDFLVNNLVLLIIGIVLFVVLLFYLYKNVKIFRITVQWITMHVPILSKIIIYNEVTMFSKTFASLWNHNVFITSSMEILSKITDNEIYKMLIFDAITNVARGDTVSKAFKNHWAFPIVAYEMLVTGERTGQPGVMMEKVAAHFQNEQTNAVNQIKAFIEPVLIIFLAVVVGVILLAVVLPMFNIYQGVGVG